jgi:arylsulfatase
MKMRATKTLLLIALMASVLAGCNNAEPAADTNTAEAVKPEAAADANAARVAQAPATTPPGTAYTGARAIGDRPNIVVIMGDDIGIWNIGAYNRGMMAGRTPNIDQLAREGAIFTDYYAEASCTAGRANFITGELPIRTGLTTVGQAGSKIGMPDAAPTIATVLKDMGYATGQFGKNHLGDLNKFLPTLHGFDEFFGYLYHLDAMEDPFFPTYPSALKDKVGPRDLLHTLATDKDDATVDPRWGKVGKQKIVDEGPLPPHPTKGIKYNMETVDDHILEYALNFMDKAKKDDKPFFVWLNPTRMHVITHLSPKYEALRTPENGWSIQEAGMAQFDDIIGSVMKKLDDMGEADNTIIVVTTDNGTEVFTWPDGGTTPFKGSKGMGTEGGFRAPAIIRWPGRVKPNQVINGIMSGMDWFPTFVTAAGNPNITKELLKGKTLGGKNYKVHLDGYDQTDMLTKGGKSTRNEIFYFTQSDLTAVRVNQMKYVLLSQPNGWFGGTVKLNWPKVYNLRLDPFERMGFGPGESLFSAPAFYVHEIWRFVFMQQEVAKLAKTAIDYPPMQAGASFNLDEVKKHLEEVKNKVGQ